MNSYKNTHLLEVACTFNFLELETNKKWDSSYFGLFYEKIKSEFNEREERKGIQIQFSATPEDIKNNTVYREVNSTMIFRNTNDGYAIILSKNSISFNKIGNYTNWTSFSKEFISKFYTLYLELELNYKIKDCQIVYLNSFKLRKEDDLSNYFNLISKVENIGEENFCHIQRNFIVNERISLQGKLFCNINPFHKLIQLECGAVSLPKLINENLNFLELANETKAPIRGFFEQIITDSLKTNL